MLNAFFGENGIGFISFTVSLSDPLTVESVKLLSDTLFSPIFSDFRFLFAFARFVSLCLSKPPDPADSRPLCMAFPLKLALRLSGLLTGTEGVVA